MSAPAAPKTYIQAITLIAATKARGGRVLCGMQCGREASLVLACEDGTLQGVGCQPCWDKHLDMIKGAKVFEASGMASPFCSRCGMEAPPVDHIKTEEI
jgi:hypothetical protein